MPQAAAHEKVIATSFKCMQDLTMPESLVSCTCRTLKIASCRPRWSVASCRSIWPEDSLSKLTHERYRGFANLQVGGSVGGRKTYVRSASVA